MSTRTGPSGQVPWGMAGDILYPVTPPAPRWPCPRPPDPGPRGVHPQCPLSALSGFEPFHLAWPSIETACLPVYNSFSRKSLGLWSELAQPQAAACWMMVSCVLYPPTMVLQGGTKSHRGSRAGQAAQTVIGQRPPSLSNLRPLISLCPLPGLGCAFVWDPDKTALKTFPAQHGVGLQVPGTRTRPRLSVLV